MGSRGQTHWDCRRSDERGTSKNERKLSEG